MTLQSRGERLQGLIKRYRKFFKMAPAVAVSRTAGFFRHRETSKITNIMNDGLQVKLADS